MFVWLKTFSYMYEDQSLNAVSKLFFDIPYPRVLLVRKLNILTKWYKNKEHWLNIDEKQKYYISDQFVNLESHCFHKWLVAWLLGFLIVDLIWLWRKNILQQ